MSIDAAFENLVGVLKKSVISDEDGYLVAELPADVPSITDDFIKEQLELCSYNKIDRCIDDVDGKKLLYLNRGVTAWGNSGVVINQTHSGFWQQNVHSKGLPKYFFIQEDKSSSCDSPLNDKITGYKAFFSWKILISSLAHYEDNNSVVLFIINDKEAKKVDIPLFIDSAGLNEITSPRDALEYADKLKSWVDIKDAHEKERLSVMRASLADVVDSLSSDSENILLSLMKKSGLLLRKYDELYDIYTKRFSINKILNELDEKSLEYTSKINEYISSSQNKALTIPGALIAVGALAKVGGAFEGAIIFGGLWMIKTITKTANDIYRDSFASLSKRLESAFKKYLRFDEGKEVRENAMEIEADLKGQVAKAVKRLDKIDAWANYMLWGGVFYLIATLVVHYYPNSWDLIKKLALEIGQNLKALNQAHNPKQ